jgi:hypothetical protein
MRYYDASTREEFLERLPPGMPIRVLRAWTPLLERHGDRLVHVPAIELTYSFIHNDEQWVFQEWRIMPSREAPIDLSGTLWADIEPTGNYRLVAHDAAF